MTNNTDLDWLVRDLRTHAFDDCGTDLPTHIANIAADAITALGGEVERVVDLVRAAYIAGGQDVHDAWVNCGGHCPGDRDDLGEGAGDYVASLDLSAIAAMRPTEDSIGTADVTTDLTRELAKANREVLGLITSIWKSEFRNESPQWEPLPDLVGRITQLDNMYAGVRGQRDKARTELAEARASLEAQDKTMMALANNASDVATDLADTKARLAEAVGVIQTLANQSKCDELENDEREDVEFIDAYDWMIDHARTFLAKQEASRD